MAETAPAPGTLDYNMQMPENQLQVGAFGNVLRTLAIMGGAGVAARGIQGIGDMLGAGDPPVPKPPIPQRLVPVPIARKKDPEEQGVKQAETPADRAKKDPVRYALLSARAARDDKAWFGRYSLDELERRYPVKQADNPLQPVLDAGAKTWQSMRESNPISSWLGSNVLNAAGGINPAGENRGWLNDLVFNQNATAPGEIPWYAPAMTAAAVGGVAGGYKLTDHLLDSSRHNEQKSELEYSKKRYQDALMGRTKTAAADGTPEADPLDRLYNAIEKRGLWNPLASSLGTLGVVGLMGGIGSGVLAYDYTRRGTAETATREALKERERQIYKQAPTALLAVPHEVDPDAEEPGLGDQIASGGMMTRDFLADLGRRAGEGAHRGYRAARGYLAGDDHDAEASNDPSSPTTAPHEQQLRVYKAANISAALSGTEQRLKQRAEAYYANIAAMQQQDGKGKPAAQPAEPQPYRPPSIAHSLQPQPAQPAA